MKTMFYGKDITTKGGAEEEFKGEGELFATKKPTSTLRENGMNEGGGSYWISRA